MSHFLDKHPMMARIVLRVVSGLTELRSLSSENRLVNTYEQRNYSKRDKAARIVLAIFLVVMFPAVAAVADVLGNYYGGVIQGVCFMVMIGCVVGILKSPQIFRNSVKLSTRGKEEKAEISALNASFHKDTASELN